MYQIASCMLISHQYDIPITGLIKSDSRNQCYLKQHILKDQRFLPKGPIFQCSWTFIKDNHVSWVTILQPVGWFSKLRFFRLSSLVCSQLQKLNISPYVSRTFHKQIYSYIESLCDLYMLRHNTNVKIVTCQCSLGRCAFLTWWWLALRMLHCACFCKSRQKQRRIQI